MRDMLVSPEILKSNDAAIKGFFEGRQGRYAVDFEDPDYGPAFLNYLTFVHRPGPREILGVSLDEERRFYNSYYWFRHFVELHTAKHGTNAGLEQQAYQMLEHVDFDVDFEIIEWLDREAREQTTPARPSSRGA